MNNQTTTPQQAQEIKKLYAVAMRYYGIGEITEYAVVKETPKTYAVEPLEDFTNPLNRWHRANIVKKSDMEIYDKHFCESYAAALAYKKEMLETLIASNEKRIAEMTAKNEKYRATIEATAAELQQLNGGGAL